MKIGLVIAVAAVVMIGAGGCVQTHVMKQIQVHKDVNGNITGYTEIESATQMGSAFPFHFQYLKAGADEKEALKIYH